MDRLQRIEKDGEYGTIEAIKNNADGNVLFSQGFGGMEDRVLMTMDEWNEIVEELE